MECDGNIAASLPPPPPPAPPPTLNGSNNALPQTKPILGRTSGPTRRSTKGNWTPEEDEILRAAVQRYKGKNWKKIAECVKDRIDVQCLHRWQKVLNPDLIKGPWSKEEDEIIVQLVKKYGPKKWSTISQHLPGRIGKQCRERWHNHLNPGIKKEAWTQEEELVLIRAHELYGNKWAELTKYLPGRTDNAIKNHWHSSVKKKLEFYKESGLLAQSQRLPLVSYQNQPTPTTEGEEISESSQAGCSQTPSDVSNVACQAIEDYIVSGESDQGKMTSTSQTPSSSEQYYTSLDDMTFTISDIPCEFTYSSYPDENISQDMRSNATDCNLGEISLPMNSSVELDVPENYYIAATNHTSVPGPPHESGECNVVVNNSGTDPDVVGHMPRAEEGCSQIVLTQGKDDVIVEISSDMVGMERNGDYMSFQSTYHFFETSGPSSLQPYNNISASVMEASNNDNRSSIPSDISDRNGLTMSDKKLDQINDSFYALQANSPCHDPSGFTEQTDLLGSSRLVPESKFSYETSDDQQRTPPRIQQPVLETCGEEKGSLCYEPPRFPSVDIPFFSCDLAQSGTDAQQDFSPLGIRRFMMSSATSPTPFRLWDSPSSENSPDALLKSAAKTFACTPSIFKKRHRDMLSPLSPLSERQNGKKRGKYVNQGFLCSPGLSKEFSRLEVIVDTAVQFKESTSLSNNPKEHLTSSVEDKENVSPAVAGLREEANLNHEFEAKTPEKNTHTNDLNKTEKRGTLDLSSKMMLNEECASETPRGILLERHLNDIEFLSPDRISKSTRQTEADSSKYTSKESAISESPIGNAGLFVSPPSFDHVKRHKGSAVSSSAQPVSAVTTVMGDTLVNEVGAENLNFFGGTPFRNMESPSGWKSPWYFSSLLSCPRFEPDITIEDIGIFMSPGERSFDALGLMKQINDQGADTYADAKEVLGSETPESILRQRCWKKLNLDGEISNVSDNPLKDRLHMTANAMTERRVLDFSECGTPVKSTEKMKSVCGGTSLSSPSCLLKSFR